MRRRPRREIRDRGAALLSSIGFVLMVSALGAGLLGLADSSINNRMTLSMLRNREYAADAAIELTIADARNHFATYELKGNGSVARTVFDFEIRVDWTAVPAEPIASDVNGPPVDQENFVFSAFTCVAAQPAAESCADVLLTRAQVNFALDERHEVIKTFVQTWVVG